MRGRCIETDLDQSAGTCAERRVCYAHTIGIRDVPRFPRHGADVVAQANP
jgi:hypothetical protein